MADLDRERYVKKQPIRELFAAEQEGLIPLPKERFRVFTLETLKTDKYSFIHFDNNRYSTDSHRKPGGLTFGQTARECFCQQKNIAKTNIFL